MGEMSRIARSPAAIAFADEDLAIPTDRDESRHAPPKGTILSLSGPLLSRALIGLQLALILAVVYRLDVAAQNHFFPVLCIAVGGFLVRAWLPAHLRAAFFCLLSLSAILLYVGWPGGAWAIGLGCGLIAISHLPIRFPLRVAMAAVAALALSMLRIQWDHTFWPLLGSMFMFRLILYLYELRRARCRPPLAFTLAYFFPLPNVCFLFFPIFDFKTFCETYQADSPPEAAQMGIGWIVRGLSHLLAYRIIKYYVLPAPYEIVDLPHLALFLATNYALYLHVSGYFHIITGILHLFGFQLPRTHHNYFLASSFTDIWRRINIPWKDFMMKVFFFPAFFTMRGWGTAVAAAIAVFWVFLATWFLHAYQVFWVTGSLQLSPASAGLWLAAGVLVAFNLQWDLAHANRKREGRFGSFPLSSLFFPPLKIVGMFLLVSFFWACWNTPAVFVFFRAQLANGQVPAGGAVLVAALLAVVGAGVVIQLARAASMRLGLNQPRFSVTAQGLALSAALAGCIVLTIPSMAALFGPQAAGVIVSLQRETLSPMEAALVVQGYYEEILDARVRTSSWLATLEGHPIPRGSTTYSEMTRLADALLERELIPGWSGEVDGVPMNINRLGMRDRPDRQQKKPAGVCRIALVGSSVVMGYGVRDEEPFARVLEDRLNRSSAGAFGGGPLGGSAARDTDSSGGVSNGQWIEVLNFGTGKSYPIHRHVLIDRKVFSFAPDAIYYVAHQDELLGTVQHLTKLVAGGRELPYPSLRNVVQKAGIQPDTAPGMVHALLEPLSRDVVLATYRDLVEECRQRGVLAVWVYLPMPGFTDTPAISKFFRLLAEEGGFLVVDLSDWAGQYRPGELKRGERDEHPNALGHRLIAGRLYEELHRRPELLPPMPGG